MAPESPAAADAGPAWLDAAAAASGAAAARAAAAAGPRSSCTPFKATKRKKKTVQNCVRWLLPGFDFRSWLYLVCLKAAYLGLLVVHELLLVAQAVLLGGLHVLLLAFGGQLGPVLRHDLHDVGEPGRRVGRPNPFAALVQEPHVTCRQCRVRRSQWVQMDFASGFYRSTGNDPCKETLPYLSLYVVW